MNGNRSRGRAGGTRMASSYNKNRRSGFNPGVSDNRRMSQNSSFANGSASRKPNTGRRRSGFSGFRLPELNAKTLYIFIAILIVVFVIVAMIYNASTGGEFFRTFFANVAAIIERLVGCAIIAGILWAILFVKFTRNLGGKIQIILYVAILLLCLYCSINTQFLITGLVLVALLFIIRSFFK